MNDDDRTLLASVYLDDEATPEERALVESDPSALAEVARLRSVRVLLGDVEPPPISVRERQLAAALDAWDRIPDAERTGARRDATPPGVDAVAAAAASSVSTPSRLIRRRRGPSTAWLTAAAAGLVAVLAVGIVIQLDTGNDDDSASIDVSAELMAEGTIETPANEATADDAEDSDAAGAAESAAPDLDDEALEARAAEDGGELDTGINNAAPPAELELVVLTTPDDLALFAADAVDVPRAPDVPAATSAPVDADDPTRTADDSSIPRCPGIDIVVGPAMYTDTEVVVGIDVSRDLAIASTMTDCREVARSPLP